MQLNYRLEATDGLMSSTDPISWTPATSNSIAPVALGTLMKVNIPNVNDGNQKYYPFKVNSVTDKNFAFRFNDADNTWAQITNGLTISTTQGLKIVTIPGDNDKVFSYIVTESSQYDKIPAISAKMRVETYISEDITAANFKDYRAWDHLGSVTTLPEKVFLTFTAMGKNPFNTTQMQYGSIYVAIRKNGEADELYLGIESIPEGYTTTNQTEFNKIPVISTRYYSASAAPTPIQSLDDRVTSLENSMTGIISQLETVTNLVLSIEERVNKILSSVSTVFVSR